MAIKRVFEVKDKNYGYTMELFGSFGYYEQDNIKMCDTNELAQNSIENVADIVCDDTYEVDKQLLLENITSVIKDISNQLIIEVFKTAIEQIEEDEEIEWAYIDCQYNNGGDCMNGESRKTECEYTTECIYYDDGMEMI